MAKISTFRALVASAALASGASVAHSADGPALGTMKPNHGISFDIGADRGVSFFQSKNGVCQVVLTVGGEPDWSGSSGFKVTRFEATVSAGKSARYQGEGHAIDFSCHSGAVAMTAHAVLKFEVGKAN